MLHTPKASVLQVHSWNKDQGGVRESPSQPLLLFHLWVSDLRVSCKLHLVIKSIASQCRCPPSHFMLSKAIFFPLPLSAQPRRGSHGSEAMVCVTLEWSSRKASAVRSTRSLSAFMENLIEETWKDLSASREDSACCSPSGKAHT